MRGNLDDLFFGSGTSTSPLAPEPPTPDSPEIFEYPGSDINTLDPAEVDDGEDFDEVDDVGPRPTNVVPPTKFRDFNPHYRYAHNRVNTSTSILIKLVFLAKPKLFNFTL